MPNDPLRCRHLHAEGRQCGSPALRGEKLCFHHHARRRPTITPTLPDPEDLHAVQRGLAELLRLVTRELIDDKQAKRLFAILAQAGTNLARIERADRADRAAALAEARFAARHPEASFSTAHARRQAASVPEALVTDPVDDPELSLIAPEPASGPAPGPAPEPNSTATEPLTPPQPSGYRILAQPHRESVGASIPPPPPEQPSRARQAQLAADAGAEAEFQRREDYRLERQRLRIIAREVMYPLLSPAARAKEDALRAEEAAYAQRIT